MQRRDEQFGHSLSTPHLTAGSPRRSASSVALKEALERAVALPPASFDLHVRQKVPWQRPEDYAHMLEGLRKAPAGRAN